MNPKTFKLAKKSPVHFSGCLRHQASSKKHQALDYNWLTHSTGGHNRQGNKPAQRIGLRLIHLELSPLVDVGKKDDLPDAVWEGPVGKYLKIVFTLHLVPRARHFLQSLGHTADVLWLHGRVCDEHMDTEICYCMLNITTVTEKGILPLLKTQSVKIFKISHLKYITHFVLEKKSP